LEYRRYIKRKVASREPIDPLSQITESLVIGGESFLKQAKNRLKKKAVSQEQLLRKRWNTQDQEQRICSLVKVEKDR
jgi:hypothetical protein